MKGHLLLPLIAFACSGRIDPVETGTIVVDGDADTDTDTDTDSDTDADTDTDTGPRLDCAAVYDTPAPGSTGEDTCVTERVYCGDVLFGTTEGGSSVYDWDFWHINQKTSNMVPDDIAGTERVYTLEGYSPGDAVRITVESCDPTRAAFYYSGSLTPTCYTGFTNTPMQHFTNLGGRLTQEMEDSNQTANNFYTIQMIIDAEVGANTNYMLTVECLED